MPAIPRWLFWAVKNTARRFGCDIVPYDASNHWFRFSRLLAHHGITCYLDVGANVGQHGSYLRNIGYRGRIISFEPVSRLFAQLSKLADNDPLWETQNCGLGDENTTAEINLMEDPLYNSILQPTEVYEHAKIIGRETIMVRTLDSLFPELIRPDETVFLKLDAQGFEERILRGAQQCLPRIAGLVVESSICSGYQGEMLFREMDSLITQHGFELASMAPHTGDNETGQLFQFDAVYYRAA